MLWELATTGLATFPSGAQLQVSPSDWFGIVKFLYSQIDGPPKTEVDVTTGGEALLVQYVNDWRDSAADAASGPADGPA